jgi:hypothetical protein
MAKNKVSSLSSELGLSELGRGTLETYAPAPVGARLYDPGRNKDPEEMEQSKNSK